MLAGVSLPNVFFISSLPEKKKKGSSSYTNILDPATSETKPWEFIKSENGTSENSQSPWGERLSGLC